MFRLFGYRIVLVILLSGLMQARAQIAMPDTVCMGTTRLYQINDAATPSTYTWKIDGVTQTAISNEIPVTWNAAGVFLLTVQEHSASGCDGDIKSGLVYVNPPPVANAGTDTIVCFGNTTRLNGSGGSLYQWSPSAYLSNPNLSNPLVTIPVAGTYQYVLTVSSNGCKSPVKDSVAITVLPQAKIFAGRDTSVSINQPLHLNAIDISGSGFVSYSWLPPAALNNPFSNNPIVIATLPQTITYRVTAKTTEGCMAEDDITIKIFAAPEIYVPNAFTPDKDGLNDILKPVCVGINALKYFSVYNRFGQLVYTTSTLGTGWNGLMNGAMQNTGAYVWIAEAEDYQGNILKRHGTAILIK